MEETNVSSRYIAREELTSRERTLYPLSLSFKSKSNVVSLPPLSRGVGSPATEKRSEESERECYYLM